MQMMGISRIAIVVRGRRDIQIVKNSGPDDVNLTLV